jgi:hypothetical protein
MRRGPALLTLVAMLVVAPAAVAQEGGSPFGPVAPSGQPAPSQEQPAPAPQQVPSLPPVLAAEEDELSPAEALPLVGMSVLLFVAVGVAIARDARRAPVKHRRRLAR